MIATKIAYIGLMLLLVSQLALGTAMSQINDKRRCIEWLVFGCIIFIFSISLIATETIFYGF